MFQITSKSVHFWPSYSRMRENRSLGPYRKSTIRPKAFGWITTSTSIFEDWRISTHADPTSTRRAISRKGISSENFTSAHFYHNVYIPVGVARVLVDSFDFGLLGSKFHKNGIPINRRAKFDAASFILGGVIRNGVTVQTLWLSAFVDKKCEIVVASATVTIKCCQRCRAFSIINNWRQSQEIFGTTTKFQNGGVTNVTGTRKSTMISGRCHRQRRYSMHRILLLSSL